MRRPCKGYYLRWYYNGWHYWFFLPGKSLVVTEGERYRTIGTKKVSMCSGQVTQSQIDAIRTIFNSKEVSIYTNAGFMNIRIESTPMLVYNNQIAGYEMDFTALIGSKEISYITGYSPIIDIPTVIIPPITQCEVIIGTQVWMCKNFDILYPGSKVYNNNEANRAIYGGLYTLSQVNNPGFCPVGWHVPTLDDWNILINFLGGDIVAGAHLKETGLLYWDTETADNSSGFAARGSGLYFNGYNHLSVYGNLWYNAGMISIQANLISVQIIPVTTLINYFIAVRLIKNSAPIPPIVIFNDWFLGSLEEVRPMYDELKLYGAGNFTDDWYWTSSEDTAISAIAFDFTYDFTYTDKTTICRVRACRIFVSSDIYALRSIGPAGGLIYIIIDLGSGLFRYYEAASADQSAGRSWSDITNKLAGSTDTAIGAGQTNTNLIVAQVTEDLDWFLPSKDELYKMQLNLDSGLDENSVVFAPVGGFIYNHWYWSSTETSPTTASKRNFNNSIGQLFNLEPKQSVLSAVRACRTFITTDIYALRDVGPAGGLIFIVINNGGGLFTYFEVHPTDQSDSQKWSNILLDEVGGTDHDIGTGPSNTILIINQPGHTDSAAGICNALNVGGTTVDSAAKLCDDLVI